VVRLVPCEQVDTLATLVEASRDRVPLQPVVEVRRTRRGVAQFTFVLVFGPGELTGPLAGRLAACGVLPLGPRATSPPTTTIRIPCALVDSPVFESMPFSPVFDGIVLRHPDRCADGWKVTRAIALTPVALVLDAAIGVVSIPLLLLALKPSEDDEENAAPTRWSGVAMESCTTRLLRAATFLLALVFALPACFTSMAWRATTSSALAGEAPVRDATAGEDRGELHVLLTPEAVASLGDLPGWSPESRGAMRLVPVSPDGRRALEAA
jgi:hypothetical protein